MELEVPQLFKISVYNSFIIIIFVLLVLLQVESAESADTPSYEACEPRNCGTGPNISYPFYIADAGADFCGLPEYVILCREKRPVFETSEGPYVVKDISYENTSFRLVATELDEENSTTRCPVPSRYFVFDSSSLSFSPSHADLLFFYGCNDSFTIYLETSLYPCASNSSYHSFVALSTLSDADKIRDVESCESQVAVPIDLEGDKSKQSIRSVDYVGLMKNGFILKWTGGAARGKQCRESGGRCGYEDGVVVCYCPDGTQQPVNCKRESSGSRTLIVVGMGNVSLEFLNRKFFRLTIFFSVTFVAVVVISTTIFCLWKKYSIIKYFMFCWKPRNQTRQDVDAFLRNYSPFLVRRYSYLDVKKMTNFFLEKLGQGGYGSVYKGKLRDGGLVAVKVLNKSKGDEEEFINEVATISRTSHVNVVTLLGFCYEGRKRALIYEFMPNGSLEKFIFEENPESNHHNKLGWEMLYQISLGIARGLEYLHRGCNTRILHFDIKPHNILLDEKFAPKISDFGLARVCAREESIISMLSARGTAGYIAPEVFCRNFGGVSHKSDVYSYGMMVLEMVGGRKNINVGGNTSEICFPHWIYKRIELNEELGLKRIMDEEDQIKVKKMVIVSLWCIQTDPLNRPAMSAVIEMLEGNLDSLQVPPKPFLSSPSRSPPPDAIRV